MTLRLLWSLISDVETLKLHLCTQRCYGRLNVFQNLTTSGLSILLHGIILFPDATWYDITG